MHMDKRDHLLKESLKRFLHLGIRQVKIVDLTRDLGVSTKTVYQHFGNKDDLVRECFQLYLTNTSAEFARFEAESEDVAELLVRFYHSALRGLELANPAFFQDLSIYYKDIWNSEEAFGLEHAKNMLDRGVREGIFLPYLDRSICAHTLTSMVRMMLEQDIFRQVSPEKQFTYVIWPYVRGMCTPHGREKFRQYRRAR